MKADLIAISGAMFCNACAIYTDKLWRITKLHLWLGPPFLLMRALIVVTANFMPQRKADTLKPPGQSAAHQDLAKWQSLAALPALDCTLLLSPQ